MLSVVTGVILCARRFVAARMQCCRARRGRGCGEHRNRRTAVLVVAALAAGSSLIGSPAYAAPWDCKDAPEPEWPEGGLVGTLDHPGAGAGVPGSVYREVHYGGTVWHTYDVGCVPAGGADLDTWLGNQVFNVAKNIVGVTNWAHYLIEDGPGFLDPFDKLIRGGVDAMWNSVFLRWVSVALVLLSVLVLIWSARGDLPKQTQRLALALLALAAAGASYLAPQTWSGSVDDVLFTGTADIQDGFVHLPNQPVGDRDALPTLLVDRVIYDNWLRGEFGSVDSPEAQQYGRDLLRTQVITIEEVLADNIDYVALAKAKKDRFTQIAEGLGPSKPHLQGKQGSRIGIGFLAVFQAISLALFQLGAKLVLLVALVIVRLVVIAMPAIAVLAVVNPVVLPNLLRVVGAAVLNGLILAALAGLHAMILFALFDPNNQVDTMLALMLSLIVSLLLWAIARPVKRMIAMTRMAGEQIGLGQYDPTHRLRRELRRQRRRARRGHGGDTDEERWWNRDGAATAGAGAGGGGERPEQSAGTVWAHASTVPRGPGLPRAPHDQVVPTSGRNRAHEPAADTVWAHASTVPRGPALPGTPHNQVIPAAGHQGNGRPDPTPRDPDDRRRALPAGDGDAPPTPPETSGRSRRADTDEPRRRATGEPIYDTDTQQVITEPGAGPDLRPAETYTDHDGQQVFQLWDPTSQSFRPDDNGPPAANPGES